MGYLCFYASKHLSYDSKRKKTLQRYSGWLKNRMCAIEFNCGDSSRVNNRHDNRARYTGEGIIGQLGRLSGPTLSLTPPRFGGQGEGPGTHRKPRPAGRPGANPGQRGHQTTQQGPVVPPSATAAGGERRDRESHNKRDNRGLSAAASAERTSASPWPPHAGCG